MTSICVVIPLYNKESSILQAVESALHQTVPPSEVIVVDDGSSDRSVERLESVVQQSTIRLISQAQMGPGPARNSGWAASSAEWIAFLDADDVWQADHLETLLSALRIFPEAEWAAAAPSANWGADLMTPASFRQALGLSRSLFSSDRARMDSYFCLAIKGSPLPNSSSTMVQRSALESIGGFPDALPSEDLAVWCALALRGEVAYSPRRTVTIRKDGSNTTKRLRQRDDTFGVLDANAILQRPNVAVVRTIGGSCKINPEIRKAAATYVDSLLTRHWISVILYNSQSFAREALPLVQFPRGVQYRLFVVASHLPKWLAAPLAFVLSCSLRLLGFAKPVSPFLDRKWQGPEFNNWLLELRNSFDCAEEFPDCPCSSGPS